MSMTTSTFASSLAMLLRGEIDLDEMTDGQRLDVVSYRDAGVLTSDEGLVLRFGDGSEFQLTAVQSAAGVEDWCEICDDADADPSTPGPLRLCRSCYTAGVADGQLTAAGDLADLA